MGTEDGQESRMKKVVAYVYLKENYADIKQCRSFSQKRIIRYGLPEEPVDQKSEKVNSKKINIGASKIKIPVHHNWKSNVEDIKIDQQYENQLDKHFKTKEQQFDYQDKIEYMNQYLQELNDMHRTQNKTEAIKSIRALHKKNRDDLKSYVKYKGQRFFEILPLLKKRNSTMIEQLKCFQPICNLELKQKEKYSDELFKHLNKKHDNKQEQDQKQSNNICIDYQDIPKLSPSLRRTFSQQEVLISEASNFNKNNYLFEIKNANEHDEQVKAYTISNEEAKDQSNFQQDLKMYVSKHLNTSGSAEISAMNISQMQQVIFDEIQEFYEQEVIGIKKDEQKDVIQYFQNTH
ncbi:unnamed protein product (macronuclear) [Paramecium tetraurelia]|uniref:Uncharacterized protein n=1 Tax=Paramecium tetraurelia TaxID=5888 RepID=A0DJ20_PARTE|nr:uncharacterized protein GSPATT00017394001 [Paramecium tetraurelia]CAK83037.1 unnamed protein product [Paramecium tetraurelia]|eukprot:XP_001450434.1 hypothetical protein (macronuclear) [Paramecium tetraurelia strain d4-2]